MDIVEAMEEDIETYNEAVEEYEAMVEEWDYYFGEEITRAELKEYEEMPEAPGTQVPWTPSGWTGSDFEWGMTELAFTDDEAIQVLSGYGVYQYKEIDTVGNTYNFGTIGGYDASTDSYEGITAFDGETNVAMIVVAAITGSHNNGAQIDLGGSTADVEEFIVDWEISAAPDAWESAAVLKVAAATAMIGMTMF